MFSHFLTIKPFSMLGIGGVLGCIYSTYTAWTRGDRLGMTINVLSLLIFALLTPYLYYVAKKIFKDFNHIFSYDLSQRKSVNEKGERVRYLFHQSEAFECYRRNVFQMVYDNREKYFAIGVAFCVILPLNLIQDYQRGVLSYIFSEPWSLWNIIGYSYFCIYWTILYSILLSAVWMIITVARALLSLKKEKMHLYITQLIIGLKKSLQSSKDTDLSSVNIGLLDLSFRRFKAGLLPIVDFVFSASLQIAFVGTMCSIPALIYFLGTKEIVIVWYGLCIFTGLLSIAIFVVGQYGVWRVWSSSKEDAKHLLNHICTMRTQEYLKHFHFYSSKSKETKDDKNDVSFLLEVIEDIDELTAITYTSSSIFKLAAVNFLSFGPLVLQQLLFLFLSK